MRKLASAVVLALAVLLVAGAADARGRGHGGGGHGWHGGHGGHRGHGGSWHRGHGGHYKGGTWYGGFHGPRVIVGVFPWWWGDPRWYAPPLAYPHPVSVVVQQPPVYVERTPAPPADYWYYCPSAGGYYPDVPSCPEPWVQVPPRDE